MSYTINRTNRNTIIVSAAFLILFILLSRLFYLLNQSSGISHTVQLIQNVIYLIPFGIVLLAFYKYVSHYKLKVLQVSLVLIFLSGVVFKSTMFADMLESWWKMGIFVGANLVWLVAIIVLIVALSNHEKSKKPGATSIRNYAIFALIIYLMFSVLPFFVKTGNLLTVQLVVGFADAIPFAFAIVFAVKVHQSTPQES